ncbi:MAG: methyltransferase domain-containing protein [bacterium]
MTALTVSITYNLDVFLKKKNMLTCLFLAYFSIDFILLRLLIIEMVKEMVMTQERLYPDSGVELTPYIARHYDRLMNAISFGFYSRFIHKAIADIGIKRNDNILDLGCGTGRNASLMLRYLGDEGRITGIDLSPIMQDQFEKRFVNEHRVTFQRQRIDIPFDLGKKFDIVFISFVIHGFPHEVRKVIIENVIRHLKLGGSFIILDFAEFDMAKMPALYRWVFKKIECKYAFDFIERDWKAILSSYGFGSFTEHHYIKKYVRLLKGVKEK